MSLGSDDVTAPHGRLTRMPLREQAVGVLRDMVVSGVLGPGDRINEADLASQLGISRGPLREAIQRLGAEGFVEFRQNRGAFVRSLSPEDVRHMYEVRELIEVKAASLAAQNATEEGVEEMRRLIAATDEVLRTDTTGAYPTEYDLHALVLELSGNPQLQRIGTDLQVQVRLARVRSGRSPERAREALTEHLQIISAIADRDPRRAGREMRAHLRRALDTLTA
ncbi:GntR family transcriptional regulator [Nocardioides acrostichi]|uniref:GntR family transcriptional regulator n=1 Tax=Nocardioides acrostichi TaxID=2784339 RepID=A0A930V3T1_9ACTN|nr:GntR family transcriptional regulator [Nocardioides acrostichi]MBF4163292.1 GntR family transcriptional regulator [Nocardioides acrostichi]